MAIDIYARWPGQTDEERDAQLQGFPLSKGMTGYLREAGQMESSALIYLVREVFGFSGSAVVSTNALRNRLPRALELLELQLTLEKASAEQVKRAKAEMRDFVDRCAYIEGNTGSPVTVVGMW